MANLKTFSGFPIQNLTSDPVPFAQAKINNPYAGAWSSGGNLNIARSRPGAAGIQTAALGFGGYAEPGGGLTGATEEYDGTSWTTSPGTMNTARMAMATNVYGTQSLALAYAGTPPATTATESWNGTSWITSVSMATARGQLGGAGTNDTSALAFGGSPPTGTDATEEFTGETSTLNLKTLTTSQIINSIKKNLIKENNNGIIHIWNCY